MKYPANSVTMLKKSLGQRPGVDRAPRLNQWRGCMLVKDILKIKGSQIYSIDPEALLP